MASEKILKLKSKTVKEIEDKLSNSKTVLLINYQGLTVPEVSELRKELLKTGAEFRVYKNTLVNIALNNKKIGLTDFMTGPNAYLFADDIVDSIKMVSTFAKAHKALEIRAGIIDNEVVSTDIINKYSTIPSMDGLLTMLAGGLIEPLRKLSIAINLYSEGLEKK